ELRGQEGVWQRHRPEDGGEGEGEREGGRAGGQDHGRRGRHPEDDREGLRRSDGGAPVHRRRPGGEVEPAPSEVAEAGNADRLAPVQARRLEAGQVGHGDRGGRGHVRPAPVDRAGEEEVGADCTRRGPKGLHLKAGGSRRSLEPPVRSPSQYWRTTTGFYHLAR